MKKIKVIGSLILSTSLAACSGGGSGAGSTTGGSSDIAANIAGIVSESNSSLSVQSTGGGLFSKLMATSNENSAMSVGDCAVQAYDISTGVAVGNPATTDTDGAYTLTGVTSGSTYKVVAECTGFTLASVSTADTKDPATKDKEVTSPLSSIIATMIVKEVVSQLENTFGALPQAFKDQAIKALAPTIMSLMKTLITDSVNSGTMVPPSTSEANTVAANLKVQKTAAQLDTVITNYDTVKPIPPAVTQGSKAAGAQASAMKDCDSTVTGSTVATCTKAMIKLMYNGMSFGVGLNLTSGGTNTGAYDQATCDEAGLGTDFPNAEYVSGGDIPPGFCFVKPKFKASDRNNNPNGDGGDHGPVFIESGLISATNVTGFLTELGSAFFNKNKYRFSDLDKMVFGYNSDKAGMNLRLFQERKEYGEFGETSAFYYLNSAGAWTSMGAANPQNLTSLDNSAGGWDWTPTSGSTDASLITAIGAGGPALLTKGVFVKKFGGPIPTMAQLEAMMNTSKTHTDYNPSGGKEFNVLFSEQPKFEVEDSTTHVRTRPCDDNDPTTACTGVTVQNPVVLVKVNFGTAISSGAYKNVKPIDSIIVPSAADCATSVTQIAAGTKVACFYLQPIYSQSGFSGVFNFIRTFDGQFLRDENNNNRAIKIASASDCASGALMGCSANDVFNGVTAWSNGSMTFTRSFATAITKGSGVGAMLSGVGIFNEFWQPSTSGGWKPSVIAKRTMNNAVALEMTGSVASLTTATPSLSGMSSRFHDDAVSTTGAYNVVVHRTCDINGCNNPNTSNAKVYLVSAVDGTPFSDVANDSTWDAANKTSLWTNCGPSGCTQVVTPLFSAANLISAIGATNEGLVTNFFIPSGPVANPNWRCDQEPFFKDGNGDGKLNCDTANPHSPALNNDVSYSDFYAVQRAQQMNQQSGSGSFTYSANDNAYQFSNPAGPKKLLTTAFNGWFDGAHTLSATTDLDALQAFSLIFMFFEESNKEIHLEGMDTNNQFGYVQSSPMFGNGGGDDPMKINTALGKGIQIYKQQ